MIMNLERRMEITRAAVAAYERSIAEQEDPIAVRRQQQCARVLESALEALMMTDTELDAARSGEPMTVGADRIRADAIRGEVSRRARLTFHERMREAAERRRMREASPW
jgi:hypothetical protein